MDIPDTSWVLQNIEDSGKKELLCRHSERLALAAALLHTSDDESIELVKDLRKALRFLTDQIRNMWRLP